MRNNGNFGRHLKARLLRLPIATGAGAGAKGLPVGKTLSDGQSVLCNTGDQLFWGLSVRRTRFTARLLSAAVRGISDDALICETSLSLAS